MGKVSLLDVAPTQGPTDLNAANNASMHGGGMAGDPSGGRFNILTNPDQVLERTIVTDTDFGSYFVQALMIFQVTLQGSAN